MRTAGLVLDFYDDPDKAVLKEAFPTYEEVPEIVKTAHYLVPEEHDVLRDEAYALILQNEGRTLRKFACVDEGNTLLSALYLEAHAAKLPEEAIKVAAANLLGAFEQFGLEPTEFLKEAAKKNIKRERDPMMDQYVGDEADWAQRTNLNSIQGNQPSGRVQESAAVMKTAGQWDVTRTFRNGLALGGIGGAIQGAAKAEKGHRIEGAAKGGVLGAAVAGGGGAALAHGLNTAGVRALPMPKTASAGAELAALGKKVLKGAAVGAVPGAVMGAASSKKGERVSGALRGGAIGGLAGAAGGAIGHGLSRLPDEAHMIVTASARTVDVTGLEPVGVTKTAAREHMALGTYPLDSFTEVTTAVSFFEENWTSLDPAERHEYAVKTASRADELGIATTDLLDRYGATDYAPDADAHLASRMAIVQEPELRGIYRDLREKRASIEPEVFAELLGQVDELAGLNWSYGGEVADPYFAVFGGRGKEKAASWLYNDGMGLVVNENQLKYLAEYGRMTMLQHFSDDIVNAFQKNPTQIFDSLPDDTKKILGRMAISSSEKAASAGHALVDIAGLGILARPSIKAMQGQKMSDRDTHKHELAGLGVLAGGVAHEHRKELADMGRKAWNVGKTFVSKL